MYLINIFIQKVVNIKHRNISKKVQPQC